MENKFNAFDGKMALQFIKVYDDLSDEEKQREAYRHIKRCAKAEFTSAEVMKMLEYTNMNIIKHPSAASEILLKTCKYIVENSEN